MKTLEQKQETYKKALSLQMKNKIEDIEDTITGLKETILRLENRLEKNKENPLQVIFFSAEIFVHKGNCLKNLGYKLFAFLDEYKAGIKAINILKNNED